jgi:hypothetical protein
MKILTALIISLLFIPNKIRYDIKPENKVEVYYDINRKLNWNDFVIRYTKPNNKDVCMLSFELIMESVSYGDELGKATIFCKVNKNQSWVLKDYKTVYVLNHEQRHFDIAYAYALKIVKALKCADTYSQANQIFNNLHAEMDALQIRYDAEAGNVAYVEGQKRWDQEIDKMLKNNQ